VPGAAQAVGRGTGKRFRKSSLQVRPGMVSGIYRIGGIAALIADHDRYLLATFYQENLKYVRPGQPVEVSFDLYPGQIFAGIGSFLQDV
jgi:multidrug resistance efflux pump